MNSFKRQLQTYKNMDQDEENANLSGMEGLSDYTDDNYSKWDVDILRFTCVNQLCLKVITCT